MFLLNGDRRVLYYNFDDSYIEVLDNAYLPYALKDYVQTTDFSTPDKIRQSMRHIEVLRDYLASRTLNLSRANAKAILNTLAFPQSLRTDEKIKIVEACNGLSMTDNIWICKEDDIRCFSDVNLRNHKLKDAAYQISILGKPMSVTKDIMAPDIATAGMFAKTWVRMEDGIYLWKTDKTIGNQNTLSEVTVSDLLDYASVPHVHYDSFTRDGRIIATCPCIADDNTSLISALEIRDWCDHTGKHFIDFITEHYQSDFANMCVLDYILANTDRHIENWGFLIDNKTNEIKSFAPLYDHNQALIADLLDTDVSMLLYEPTGNTMLESAKRAMKYADFQIDIVKFPEKCRERYDEISRYKEISMEVDLDIEY